MNEILKDLINSYSEKKTTSSHQFKFYSNLTVSQGLHKKKELNKQILNGINFIKKSLVAKNNAIFGFPSQWLTALSEDKSSQRFLQEFEEIYTSVLALDILQDLDEDCTINPMQGCFPTDAVKRLVNNILPDSGISTFSIFKKRCGSDDGSHKSESDPEIVRPNSVESGYGSSSESAARNETTGTGLRVMFPDDCSTTSLALLVLLREGIIDVKPTTSIMELLLSNVTPEAPPKCEGVIRTFLSADDNPTIDATACANVLLLYYSLVEENLSNGNNEISMNNEENVVKTERFLIDVLIQLSKDESNLAEENFSLHTQIDLLLWTLSRCMEISDRANDFFSEQVTVVLDKRVGIKGDATEGPLSLALRILTAYTLDLLSTPEGTWMRRKIEGEVCKLGSLQLDDGSWPAESFFKVQLPPLQSVADSSTSSKTNPDDWVNFGGKELTTMFVVKALTVFSQSEKCAHT